MNLGTLYYLYRLRKTQWLRPQELERMQWRALRRVVRHAYERVPYYRRLFDSAGIEPADIRGRADLSLIPVTTKEALQQTPEDELLTKGARPADAIHRRTSGTTGKPLSVILTHRQKEAQDMIQARALMENGLRLTDRRAVFVAPWQMPEGDHWFQRLGMWRKAHFSIFDDIREQMPVLERLAPQSLAGTPALLKLIALEKTARGSDSIAPRTIFSTGELLDRATRDLVESVFQVKVVDMYGSIELGYMAWECPEHHGYHMNMESVVMEFLRDGRPVSSGEVGEVVCTSLLGYAMPLIRYRVGDLCTPTDEPCPCGRGLPLIKLIEGGANDTIRLPDGLVVTPQALGAVMVEFGEMVRQIRIVQEDEDRIDVHLVRGRDFNHETLSLVEGGLRRVLRGDVTVNVRVVETIERDPSGKQRAIISNVRVR